MKARRYELRLGRSRSESANSKPQQPTAHRLQQAEEQQAELERGTISGLGVHPSRRPAAGDRRPDSRKRAGVGRRQEANAGAARARGSQRDVAGTSVSMRSGSESLPDGVRQHIVGFWHLRGRTGLWRLCAYQGSAREFWISLTNRRREWEPGS